MSIDISKKAFGKGRLRRKTCMFVEFVNNGNENDETRILVSFINVSFLQLL